MSLTAKDIMTRQVITVTPSTPLTDFARICAEDGISGAPVVRVDGVLVGMVSKTDLVQRLIEDSPKFGMEEDGPDFQMDERQVQDIMQDQVLVVGPDTPIGKIAERMAEDRVHRVVVTENDRVVGIVTSLDVLARYPAAE
jgi:CBS domain-containing protein